MEVNLLNSFNYKLKMYLRILDPTLSVFQPTKDNFGGAVGVIVYCRFLA